MANRKLIAKKKAQLTVNVQNWNKKEEDGILKAVDNIKVYERPPIFQEGGALHILDEEGDVQKTIGSGARIFSRKDTSRLVKLASEVSSKNETEKAKDLIKLGKEAIKAVLKQDANEPEFAEIKQ